MRRVAVLGAGIAGLSVAHRLRRDSEQRGTPVEVTVLENSPRAGGRIRTTDDSGYRVEWAANGLQGADGASWRLAEELGLADERVLARPDAARRYIYRGGTLHLAPLAPPALLQSRVLSTRGKLRLLAEPFFARRVAKDESVFAYAERHVGAEAARVLVGAMVRGVFAGDATKLSLEAAFPVMREMERKHRSLVVAMLRERRSPGGRKLWTLRGGMEGWIPALERSLQGSVRLGTPALSIEPGPGGDGTAWRISLASGERVDADAVVIATPPRSAAALLEGLEPEASRDLKRVESAGLAVVGMAFRPEAFRAPPDGYGFLVAPGEDLDVLGILFESNLFPDRAPEGRVLARAMVGGIERPDLLAKSDTDLIGLSMKALDRAIGLKSGPERTWVIRHDHAIPQYALGHRAMVSSLTARLAARSGLHLAGSGYRGISVPSILDDAERVAGRVLAEAELARS